MSALENDILEKYRYGMAAHGAPRPEPPSEDLYVHEWTNEDEYAELSEYYAFMFADGGGSDCLRLLEAYSV